MPTTNPPDTSDVRLADEALHEMHPDCGMETIRIAMVVGISAALDRIGEGMGCVGDPCDDCPRRPPRPSPMRLGPLYPEDEYRWALLTANFSPTIAR